MTGSSSTLIADGVKLSALRRPMRVGSHRRDRLGELLCGAELNSVPASAAGTRPCVM
jgi:hypothetical protein